MAQRRFAHGALEHEDLVCEIQGVTMEGMRVFTTRLPDMEVEQLEYLVPKSRQAKPQR